MFETIARGFRQARNRLAGLTELTESNIDSALREVRLSLLEADVEIGVVKAFLSRVKDKALGKTVAAKVKTDAGTHEASASDHFIKICHDEMVAMMDFEGEPIAWATSGPTGIMMVGLQGSGKTTTSAKLARWVMHHIDKKPLLVAADVYRPAAIDQLETLGASLEVPVYADRSTKDVVKIARAGIDESKRARDRVVILDTAGRLQIDEEMMQELVRLKDAVRPDEILFVADGMTGQDAVRIAEGFNKALGVTGVILTKMDGDARGGAALSIYGVLKKPIKYIGVGEKSDALEEFHPERMAGRILQMGDVVSLVEKAQEAFDATEAKKLEKKVRKEGLDLEDFLTAMKQMQKLGPMESILKMLPGVNSKMLKGANLDPKRLKHVEAIVLSMTKEERKTPNLINGSRRARIAKGSGRPISEINRLLEQFRDMQKMMKKAAGGGRMGMPPGMFGR